MSKPGYSRASHFSIVWGVMLVFMTLVEWRNLDRDPVNREILSPFIQRHVAVNAVEAAPFSELQFNDGEDAAEPPESELQYEVEFNFNGPLFLAYFFGPVLAFHGIGWLAARIRGGSGSAD